MLGRNEGISPLSLAILTMAQSPRGASGARLGMNLSGVSDFNTELPFFDVFRSSRPWVSQRNNAGWGQGPKLDLDEHGWVKRLEPNCWAETLMCAVDSEHYPAGEYTVTYEGEGEVDFAHGGTVIRRQPGRLTVQVNPSKGALFMRLLRTTPGNHVRNIRVIMPGFRLVDRRTPCWHPVFLNRWRGVACFRFMDWMDTNNSQITRWDERPKVDDANFSAKGVALEWMIDLCNRQKADAWLCMPHMADDDYVYQFARMVKERLDPSLKVYVEFSNEVWNAMFRQHHYAGEQGQKLGFGDKPWEAGWRYNAYRSVQIFRIWEKVFGGTKRIVRVLASQAAIAYVSEQIVSFRDAYKQADALAIAPYISLNISPTSNPSESEVASWSLDRLMEYVETVSLPEAIRWIREQKQVADKYGLSLIAYEGGQHLVGIGGSENNEKLTKLIMEANYHPRMGEIYRKYLRAWTELGGGLFCHFSSVSRWSKWGCWGLIQYYNEPPTPKFKAVMEWARGLGQRVGTNP